MLGRWRGHGQVRQLWENMDISRSSFVLGKMSDAFEVNSIGPGMHPIFAGVACPVPNVDFPPLDRPGGYPH